MATKKYRLNRKNSDGSYDTIHYETSSNIVVRPDGSSVEESLSNNNLPSGIITMWSGSADAIPSGWALCNGSNGTPDLRNRFIVGAGSSYSVGNTGGSDSVTLTTSQIPSHNHSFSSVNVSGTTDREIWVDSYLSTIQATRQFTRWTGLGTVNPSSNNSIVSDGSSGNGLGHTHNFNAMLSGSTERVGSNKSHENRPPYYALCFIMKQ